MKNEIRQSFSVLHFGFYPTLIVVKFLFIALMYVPGPRLYGFKRVLDRYDIVSELILLIILKF